MACSEPGTPRNNLDYVRLIYNIQINWFWLRNIYPIAQFKYAPNIIVVKLAAVLIIAGCSFYEHVLKFKKWTKNKRFPGCRDKRLFFFFIDSDPYPLCSFVYVLPQAFTLYVPAPTQSLTDLWSRNTFLPKRKPPPSTAFQAIDS